MPKGYKHVTLEQRCQIKSYLAIGTISKSQIARLVKVSASTVTREIQRNSGLKGYRIKQAHKKAQKRRSEASKRPSKLTSELKAQIKQLLLIRWSPEQISGRLKLSEIYVCHETIYKWIWADKRKGGTLYKMLRRKGKKSNSRAYKNAGRGCIKNRVDIDERPKIVDEKSRCGDFEMDTVIGKQGSYPVLVTAVDRVSKYTIIQLSPDKTAENVSNAIIQGMSKYPGEIETLTYDNGKEFSEHEKVSEALHATAYFAKTFHSWQRPLNEHTNGLIREDFPKGSDFSKITTQQVKRVEFLLNLRPRKSLNYLTPFEIVHNTKLNLFNIALQS